MMEITLHSQNLRGKYKYFVNEFLSLLNKNVLTIILIQDMGNVGPNGPNDLREALAPHSLIVNTTQKNKSRSTGIILHKNWEIRETHKHDSGGLTGALIRNGKTTVLAMSAYLPTGLDGFGMPESFDSTEEKERSLKQEEAHSIYSTAEQWTRSCNIWILGGDLNETIEDQDRKSIAAYPYSRLGTRAKFITNFLQRVEGVDLWRNLFPLDRKHPTPDHTCFQREGTSARLDYFLISKELLQHATTTRMTLGDWYKKASDHVRITCQRLQEMFIPPNLQKRVIGIRKPNISALTSIQLQDLTTSINHQLRPLQYELATICRRGTLSINDADEISQKVAKIIVENALQVQSTRNKGKDSSKYVRRLNERLQTIKDTCDLIRQIRNRQFVDQREEEERLIELDILLNRLCLCDIPNLPCQINRETIQIWVEKDAPEQIRHLENILKIVCSQERQRDENRKRDMFLNPQTKGKWLDLHFKTSPPAMPDYAVDEAGIIHREPEKVKETYLREGTLFLRKKLEAPGPEEEEIKYEPPPVLNKRESEGNEGKRERANDSNPGTHPNPKNPLPKWWSQMYSRNVKNIPDSIWQDLMKEPSVEEICETIQKIPKDKAAGYDGVEINLVKLLTQDNSNPMGVILQHLFRAAFSQGTTLPSWRKAVITMIPKRREDGSWTEKIRDMRPISVLQEFGKIASKILAERWGTILLEHSQILSSAQRAFIKDGCVQQCIATALNIFEDFQERKDKKELYVVSYDQEKAYDSVQTYTIRASLERFNMPEKMITYILSGLQGATSCFKTFFGLTDNFEVETSVRQGDPLSPLVYICVADALHTGWKTNPLSGQKTGYTFSNDASITVPSTGYADDAMIYAMCWKDVWMMHQWTLEFCRVHGFRISPKTKYFISSYQGETDPRWLPAGDGSQIRPLPPSTEFRYLGTYISLDLSSSKQIQIINKMIMNWRWRAISQKIDPAMLASTIVEYLLPKIELGLLYAYGITEEMCQGWTRTIIHTLSQNGGMPKMTAKTMNRGAFCVLAGIPDINLRRQTLKIAELFVLLNSSNCVSGKTTVARLCALEHKSVFSTGQILQQLFRNETKINHRAKNRLGDTIKWMKQLDLRLTEKGQDQSDIPQKIRELSQVLERNTTQSQHLIAYTDGSTELGVRKSKNSGYGIRITTDTHTHIFSGGGAVRSDHNNFIAEMAAATVVIQALPPGRKITLYVDSMATIEALDNLGPTSERRRIKSPGRAWKNFIRTRKETRGNEIIIRHIKSHEDIVTPQQQGNDHADRLAKHFMSEAKELEPLPYFITAEEKFLIFHKDTLIGGNIREWLKEQETERLKKEWKKCKVQGRLFCRFPQQIRNLSKSIKTWSIERTEGKAWIFFIFAACDWLPTNYRVHCHSDQRKTICNLCQGNATETTAHLFTCPALREEQNALREHIDATFNKWSIPYSALGHLPGFTLKSHWIHILQKKLSTNSRRLTLSKEKMQQLVEDYWAANESNRHKAFPHFWKCVNKVLSRYNCICPRRHSCELRNCWTTPPSLVALLQRHFHLEVEGMGDALHHSTYLKEWFSLYPEDSVFGARHDFFKQDLRGRNTYVNPPFNTFEGKHNLIEKVMEKIADSLRSDLPTRVILLIPIFEGKIDHLYETQAKKSRFLEIATFPKKSFSFVAPEHYHIHNNFQPEVFAEQVGLYLCANKSSLQVDPVNWDFLVQDLQQWSDQNTKFPATISSLTREKFAQRVLPGHKPRSFSTRNANVFNPSSNFFHYYDFAFPCENETASMKTYVPNPRHLTLLARLNQHDRFAGVLGILPNHLIQLIQLTNQDNLHQILHDLRFTTFWATYNLWKKRQSLNRIFWNTAPNLFKKDLESKKKKTTKMKTAKKRTIKKGSIWDDCKNPFHSLALKDKERPIQGTCDCSIHIRHREQKLRLLTEIKDQGATSAENKIPASCQSRHTQKSRKHTQIDTSGLDYKYPPPLKSSVQPDIKQFFPTKTAADISREEQDRKKRFKLKSVASLDIF